MEIRTLKAAQLRAAPYNPRRDLQPEDAEYQKLRRSIETFGYIEPIIWNERTGNVVGGHQQLDEAGEMEVTGFEDWELQSLLMQYDHIKDLMEEDFSGYSDGKERDTFTMTFSLPAGARETVEQYIQQTENAKTELATAIINRVKGVI